MAKGAIYMRVSADEYELPEYVADTVPELARMCGMTPNTIYASISHAKNGCYKRSLFVKVEPLEDGDTF